MKNFLGSIIVLSGLLLSACNGGGGGGGTSSGVSGEASVVNGNNDPKPLSSYNSITKFTVESALSVDIKDNKINVVMLYDTNFAESRNVTFTTTGKYVTLNNVVQDPNGTLNTFESGGTVDYIVYAENGESQTYSVTLIRSAPFVAYYPANCKLNSDDSAESCACLQDTTTGDVWTRTTSSNNQCYNSLMSESGICNNVTEPSEIGYIPNLNKKEMCGFNSGWDLPSDSQLTTMSNYVSGVSNGQKGTWFNEHGFSEIQNSAVYWGQCYGGATNCTLPSGTGGNAWFITMNLGAVGDSSFQSLSPNNAYGWGVHSKP